jgi:hypothetical protein
MVSINNLFNKSLRSLFKCPRERSQSKLAVLEGLKKTSFLFFFFPSCFFSAYGAKITRPAGLSAAVSLAAMRLNRPVKMAMRIEFQNDMIGKRNQFKTVYKIGAQKNGVVNAIQIQVYQQVCATEKRRDDLFFR